MQDEVGKPEARDLADSGTVTTVRQESGSHFFGEPSLVPQKAVDSGLVTSYRWLGGAGLYIYIYVCIWPF